MARTQKNNGRWRGMGIEGKNYSLQDHYHTACRWAEKGGGGGCGGRRERDRDLEADLRTGKEKEEKPRQHNTHTHTHTAQPTFNIHFLSHCITA